MINKTHYDKEILITEVFVFLFICKPFRKTLVSHLYKKQKLTLAYHKFFLSQITRESIFRSLTNGETRDDRMELFKWNLAPKI